MSNRRSVFQRDDGKWVNQLAGNERMATVSETQNAAVADAKRMLKNSGGGDLTVFGEDGKIVRKDAIAWERWIDMTRPSGAAELLLRIDGLIALIAEHDYPEVLWMTSGQRWLEELDLRDVSSEAIEAAQLHVDAAHAALLESNTPVARVALADARQAIAEAER